MLLPLTESLYVSGSVVDTKHVKVDIGTNYYVEVLLSLPFDVGFAPAACGPFPHTLRPTPDCTRMICVINPYTW